MKKFFIILACITLCFSVAYGAQQTNSQKHIAFKGLNTKAGPLSLDDGESPNCMNVHTSIFSTLIKRNGYVKQNTHGATSPSHTHITTSPGKFNGLYDYALSSSTSKLVSYVDTNLYYTNDLDGVCHPIATPNSFSNEVMTFENFDGTLIMTTLDQDYAQKWTGGEATAHLQITPKGRYQIKAYNRWFLSDVDVSGTSYPLRFYYTQAGTFETISSYETLDANSGDVAMGWGTLKGRLYGFTKYSVSLITDEGGNDPIFVTKRIDGTGCGASRTIKTINHPKLGECMIWLTNDKRLVLWNGSQLGDIGDKISSDNGQCSFYLQGIDSTLLYKAHAQVYEAEGWYVLFVPMSASGIDYALIYDYKTDTFWPFDNQNFDASALVSTDDGNKIYVGDRTGGMHLWDSYRSDDTAAINAYWTSTKWTFDFMPAMKKMGELQIALKTVGNYNLVYQDRYNFETSWGTAENLLMYQSEWLLGENLPAVLGGAQAAVHRMDIDNNFNLFQIRLTSNNSDPAFEVYSLDLMTQKAGINE